MSEERFQSQRLVKIDEIIQGGSAEIRKHLNMKARAGEMAQCLSLMLLKKT